jgi:hypothetical protein
MGDIFGEPGADDAVLLADLLAGKPSADVTTSSTWLAGIGVIVTAITRWV